MTVGVVAGVLVYLAFGVVLALIVDAAMIDGELERWKAWVIVAAYPLVAVWVMLVGVWTLLRAGGRLLFGGRR